MGPRLVATRMLVTQHLGQVLRRLPFNTHKQSLLSRLTVSGRGMSLLPTCSPAPPEIFTWLFINVSSLLCSTSPPVNHFSHWSPEHEKWMRSRSTCPGALAQVGDLTGSDLVHMFFQSSDSPAPPAPPAPLGSVLPCVCFFCVYLRVL